MFTNLVESRRRNEKFGWRRRSRNLLDGEDDDLCGPKQEFVPCSDPACYQFEKETGECIPDDGKCGNGLRKNSWTCRNSQGKIVAGRFCGDDQGKISLNNFMIIEKFSVTPERCRLRCPGECVMSEWSNWTECPNSCQALSKFTKTRWKFATGQSFNGFADCSNETVTETVDCMAKRK